MGEEFKVEEEKLRRTMIDIIKQRRSERKFSDKPIDKEILKDIVDCARLAPTAFDVQPWHFVVITDPQIKNEIAKGRSWEHFVSECPAVVAVLGQVSFNRETTDFGSKNLSTMKLADHKVLPYVVMDCCTATENLIIAAQVYGIDSCWVAGYPERYTKSICEILRAPDDYELINLVALGYAKELEKGACNEVKKGLNQVMSFNKFEQ